MLRSVLASVVLFVGCADEEPARSNATDVGGDAGVHADATNGDARVADAAFTPDASSPGSDDASVQPATCALEQETLRCTHQSHTIESLGRDVHYAIPAGTPPSGGWPVVVFFQGSFFSSENSWEATPDLVFGAYHLVETFESLLNAGYAIVAPEAHLDGNTFWDTNVPPWSVAWSSAPDHQLMVALFDEIAQGVYGPIDDTEMFAMGISSGGYMSSRMAVSYPGKFKALVVHSASYATCSGAICLVPELPVDHPPTLLAHGENDLVAPFWAMQLYQSALVDGGFTVETVTDPDASHEWIEPAVSAIPAFFNAHR